MSNFKIKNTIWLKIMNYNILQLYKDYLMQHFKKNLKCAIVENTNNLSKHAHFSTLMDLIWVLTSHVLQKDGTTWDCNCVFKSNALETHTNLYYEKLRGILNQHCSLPTAVFDVFTEWLRILTLIEDQENDNKAIGSWL